MKSLINLINHYWKSSFIFKTLLSSTMSFINGIVFAIFNGIMGVMYHSLWNGTICIYYIFLTTIRGVIILCQRNKKYRSIEEEALFRSKISRYTHLLLVVLNVSLIVPIKVMIESGRNYTHGLIIAIGMAAYTTYRIIISVSNLNKSRKESNCLIRELRFINMIDTLVAILTLQNALIIANGGQGENMTVLTIYTSSAIFALIVFITIRSMIVNK